jgi:hypothetical protein
MAKPMSTTSEQHDGTPQLLRPRFFPGQLLTDRNLTDIIGWVKSRFLLTRGENAWGIVCGMSVSKGKKDSTCEVSAGVAVDVAGNPIAFHDSDPAAWKTIELPLVASIDRDNCTNIHAGSTTNDKYTIGPYENVTAKKWAVFDLSVCAKDRDEDPVPTPCGKDRKCQETRTRESGELHLTRVKWSELTQPTSSQSQPDRARVLLEQFENAYSTAYSATNTTVALDVQEIRKWFLWKWNAEPELLRTYPGLPHVVEQNPTAWFGNPANIAKLLTWLTDSLRREVQPCDFQAASCPANAVPLARIWAEAVGNYYHVRVIEDVSPLRREYGSDIEARLDPRRYLGRNVDEVIAELGRLGIPAKGEAREIPGTGKALKDIYEAESSITASGFKPGEPVVVLYWKSAADKPSVFVNGVFAFRKSATNEAVSGSEKPLDVRLFIPKVGMVPNEITLIDTMPPAAEELSPSTSALPAGGQVRIAVSLDAFDFNHRKSVYKIKYFDEITGKIFELPQLTSEPRTIVANVQIPQANRNKVSVTVIAEEQGFSQNRVIARTGEIKVADRALAIANLAELPNPEVVLATFHTAHDNKTPVIRLRGRDARLPLSLTVRNVLTNVEVPLRMQKDAPANPTVGTPSYVIAEYESEHHHAVGILSISMPTENELSYWVYDAKAMTRDFDAPIVKREKKSEGAANEVAALMVSFVDPTTVPKVVFADLKLEVAIQPTEAGKAKLVLKNREDKTITIAGGSVVQLTDGANSVSPGNPVIVAGGEATTPNLHRVNDTDYWRVKLDYSIDGQKFIAAIDVKAEAVPVPGSA